MGRLRGGGFGRTQIWDRTTPDGHRVVISSTPDPSVPGGYWTDLGIDGLVEPYYKNIRGGYKEAQSEANKILKRFRHPQGW